MSGVSRSRTRRRWYAATSSNGRGVPDADHSHRPLSCTATTDRITLSQSVCSGPYKLKLVDAPLLVVPSRHPMATPRLPNCWARYDTGPNVSLPRTKLSKYAVHGPVVSTHTYRSSGPVSGSKASSRLGKGPPTG